MTPLSYDLSVLALANLTVGQPEDAQVIATLATAAAISEAGGLQTNTLEGMQSDVKAAIVEDNWGRHVRD